MVEANAVYSTRSIDAKELTVKVTGRNCLFVDALGQRREIAIHRARHNSGVAGGRTVQGQEVTPVESQYGPPMGRCKFQDFLVIQALVGPPRFETGEHVVPQAT